MPIFKTYRADHDFIASIPETDMDYAKLHYVYLKLNIMVETTAPSPDDEMQNIVPIVVSEEHGLMRWNRGESCWVPVVEEIARAYADYVAEKEILK